MQSINEGKRYMSVKAFASTTRQREGKRATPKAAMTGKAGVGTLVLLSLASVGLIVFGSAYEVVSAPKAETPTTAVAAKPEDSRNAPRDENVLSLFATPVEKLLLSSGDVKLHRDGNR